MTSPNPLLQSAVARVVTALEACCETAKRDDSIIDLSVFAAVLRNPVLGLTPGQIAALEAADEKHLVSLFWRQITERRDRLEYALGEPAEPPLSH